VLFVSSPKRLMILLASVLYQKQSGGKKFVIIDAAMNDLVRPALYGARHPIINVSSGNGKHGVFNVVGPVCESGDFIGVDMEMPAVTRCRCSWRFDRRRHGFDIERR